MPYEGPVGDDQLRPSKSKKKKESKGIVADFFGNLAETAAVPFQAAGRLVKGIYEYGKTEEEEETAVDPFAPDIDQPFRKKRLSYGSSRKVGSRRRLASLLGYDDAGSA